MNRILVVDDEPGVRVLILRILTDENYRVHLFGYLAAAKEADARAPYDLVITDGLLPDGNGARWAEDLLASGRRVILASASETAQGVPTLVKPFKPDDLKQLVAQVLKNA